MSEPRKEVLAEGIEIWLGDCRDVLPLLGRVDAVVTDPPYDERTHGGAYTTTDSNEIDFAPLTNAGALATSLLEISDGWCLCFCPFEDVAKYRDAVWPEKAWVRAGVWDRVINTPQFTGDRPGQGGEAIAIFHRYARKRWNGGGKAAIWRHAVERGQKQHPTQKPLALIQELVGQFSFLDEVVLDPFMGSGTTGVACVNLGRQFIGIEREPKYFDIARRRTTEALAQPRLAFDEPVKVKQESLL